jgi:glycosyltransferase 2 family protein
VAQVSAIDIPRDPSRRKIPSWLPQVIGYATSAACLLWVLHGYPLIELKEAIQDLDWKWIGIAVVSDLVVYVVHGWRWQTLLSPVARLGFWRTVQAIYIGLFANEVLPLRVGELIRCYLLTHWNDLRLSLGFASAAVERVIDGFWLITAFVITATLVKGIPPNLILAVQILGGLLLVGSITAIWIVSRPREPHAADPESRTSATLRHVLEGLKLMGRRRSLVLTVLISALYLAIQMFSVYALLRAFRTDYSFWVAAGVLTIIRVFTIIPAAPGNLGVINVATVEALKLFELPDTQAKTFSIILFGSLTLPLLIGGAIATALTGVNIGELRERARRSADSAP